MITDEGLYNLAISLGSAAAFLIVVYHFLEVNAGDNKQTASAKTKSVKAK
ncbi:hypothetical protein QBC42DRAFT_233118 [Cladorrhinum samala]|uniref:Dolichyl-diphosphooligosaccharide--protein glycosyltransferase subunit 4 n=1 Tax=Cladorrhinum samala TaxID=585594 RepID=A0AAV9HFT6_9PEZI|nr:hypothetical protein QBC42DRAFT_233118 [Cladorrhinum samala]